MQITIQVKDESVITVETMIIGRKALVTINPNTHKAIIIIII
jgi:hypothetical protein